MIIHHKIADITFKTDWNSWFPVIQRPIFNKFRVEEIQSDVHYRIRIVSNESLTMDPPSKGELENLFLLVCGSKRLDTPLLLSPQVRGRLNDCLNQSEYVDLIHGRNLMVIRNFLQKELDIFYSPEFGGYDEELQCFLPQYYVTSNFQQIFSTFLPDFSAFLLHSSGVILDNRAAIFLAPDEGGKTTVLKQLKGEPILSDDQIILRKHRNSVIAHGTPLGVISSGPIKAKIGGFFILQKAPHFELTLLKPADLLQYIWDEHQNYTFYLPKFLKKQAFGILCEASCKVPVYRMCFPKDYVDWDAIDRAMEK